MKLELHKPTRGYLGVALAIVFAVVGCGRAAGPQRYDLSGTVTCGGQPVPAGYIVFAPADPDDKRGPGAQAEIKDGRYQTAPGQGTIGGPHVATISGFDGNVYQAGGQQNPMGMPLFTAAQVVVDLPKQSSTHDFDIAKTAKKQMQ